MSAGCQWYYIKNDNSQHGPVDEKSLANLVQQNVINMKSSLVWSGTSGVADWCTIQQIPGLVQRLSAFSAAKAPPAPQAPPGMYSILFSALSNVVFY